MRTNIYEKLTKTNQAIFTMIPGGMQNSISVAHGILEIFCLQEYFAKIPKSGKGHNF